MKTRATLLLLWVSLGLWAQAPENFKYQAVLRDASGNVKANTATTIVLSMLEGSVSGSLVYAETHAVTTNEFGLVNLTVGNGTNKTGTLAAIDWSANSYFLNVKVDGTDFGTSQLMSVPYALYAKTAGNGFSGNYNDLTNKPAAATVTETGLMSSTDKTKLEGIAAGAEVNVNADWAATTGDGLILNKPVLFSGSFADLTSKPTTMSGYGITDAFSGSYNDLTNKPTLFDGTWTSLSGKPTFATVATSGSYTDLLSKPTLFSGAFADLTGKPTTIIGYGITDAYTKTNLQTSGQAQVDAGNITNGILLVARGGTGSATLTGVLIGNGTGAFSGVTHSAANQYLRRNSANTAYEFGTLSSVAGSGDYNDLSNRPTIIVQTAFSTATGYQALSNDNGVGNTAIGFQASKSSTFGNFNTSLGAYALFSNVGNHRSTAIGYRAMYYADDRSPGRSTFSTAVGYEALRGSTTSADNTGQFNTAIGDQALYSNTSGYNNVANGVQALFSNTSGDYNTASGVASLYSNTTGVYNTANGFNSLYSNTTGFENTAIGAFSLSSNKANSRSTAIGYCAMLYADDRTTGRSTYNTAVGVEALRGSTTPANNTGQFNTAVGNAALRDNSSGRSNTAVGDNALYSVTSGNYNTAIGDGVGSIVTTGSNLTLLGYDAEPSSATAIDQITLGNGFISSLRCNVQSISSLSDQRDKKNITELSLGLNFLMQLKPRQFNWDKREWYEGNYSDGSLMQSIPTAGFIAQELDEVQTHANAEWLNLVLKDNPEKLEATYGNLLPVMVKAIQEQQQQIEKLKAENAQLKSELEQRLQKLEALLTTNHN